eukprot:Opistho-2@24062
MRMTTSLLVCVLMCVLMLHHNVHAKPAAPSFNWPPKMTVGTRSDADAAALNILNSHECMHDDLPMDSTTATQDYGSNDRRRDTTSDASATWAPIRITYSAIPGSLTELTETQSKYLMETVIPTAIDRFVKTLLVIPVAGNLTLSRWCAVQYVSLPDSIPAQYRCYQYQPTSTCGPIEVPAAHYGQQYNCDYTQPGTDLSQPAKYCKPLDGGAGIPDSDLHIYVTAASSWCNSNTVANANTCVRDQMDRSISGFINICPAAYPLLDPTQSPLVFDAVISVLRHELTHVLCVDT